MKVLVIGGGPAGALISVYLAKSGLFESINIYEPNSKSLVSDPDRSYNVLVNSRGIKALEGAGIQLQDEEGVVVVKGTARFTPGALKGKAGSGALFSNLSVERVRFAQLMMEKALTYSTVQCHYEHSLSDIDIQNQVAVVQDIQGREKLVDYDLLIGADGVKSTVRKVLSEKVPEFSFKQNLDIKAFRVLNYRKPVSEMLSSDEFQERFLVMQSKNADFLCAPRVDGILSGPLILDAEGPTSHEAQLSSQEQLDAFMAKNFPALKNPPSEITSKGFLSHPAKRFMTTYCSSLAAGRVALVGDSSHSMTASLGQGVNAALETVSILANTLGCCDAGQGERVSVDNIPAKLQEYSDKRLVDAHAVCELGEGAFLNSKDRSRRSSFIVQVAVIMLLHKLGLTGKPALFLLYEPDVPYSVVLAKMRTQKKLVLWSGVSAALITAWSVMTKSLVPCLGVMGVIALVNICKMMIMKLNISKQLSWGKIGLSN